MDRNLQLVSKTSSEIFMLRYPRSVLNFCEYDLAYFAENAIAVCNDALRDGDIDFDRVTDLRNSIKDAHVYIEHHIRTTYDKIVIDCWIDYLCRRDNVGTGSLWNRFLKCNSSFEKMVFKRLCDYRYNKAINEWLNLTRVQDYAKNKISFIFSKQLKGAEEAAARRNYFDLMFSVTAREMGCRIEDLGVTQVFTVGRLPSAPFMFPNISKDIMKNVLADFDYSEDYSDNENYGELSDQIAMDAFAKMKHSLPQEFDSYNITRTQNENSPVKVYMPCGLKAVIDLEIDALIESGGWLARCKRCGRYYLRDAEYTSEYCSLMNTTGKTCLEIYELEHPPERVTPDLDKQCRDITDIMYERVDVSMSLAEYESWKTYLDALKGKVDNGEIPAEELKQFIEYSKSLDLTKSKPVVIKPKAEVERPRERVIKPFVPERIQRSDIAAPKKEREEDPEELAARREGFFTSPSVQRQKNERAPISHIIRAGERRAESVSTPNSFVGFAEQHSAETSKPAEPIKKEQPAQVAQVAPVAPSAPVAPAVFEPTEPAPVAAAASAFAGFGAAIEPKSEKESKPVSVIRGGAEPRPYEGAFAEFGTPQQKPEEPAFDLFNNMSYDENEELETVGNFFGELPEPAPEPAPRPKVIRKNAAAISAYGRMSGAPVTAPILDQVLPKETFGSVEESAHISADPDPFKDVGSIFDGLEQGETKPVSEPAPEPQPQPAPKKRSRKKRDPEPTPEWEESATEKPAELPREVPSGIWTEERNLFPEKPEEKSELSMLKERKRSRTAKTQHLYDAIMKEPEDNPNVRKK